jgi:light-regulated signal transduction histidine kinase (bacteriophytochrome)
LQPKLATIGIIITDLTEKKKNEDIILQYQMDLESKNQELMQRNTELASFTYIASHDLKEPLRKIQTFSTRILDKDYEAFSDNTKDNFNRILSAAKRMQNLITSLLNYSRATSSESLFAKTDLNEILEEVKNNLQDSLLENNATIESTSLPIVEVMPQQFSQLFSNIISNAIKYRKPGQRPRVRINSAIVPASEMQSDLAATHSKYLEINFQDNGIGFEQQFAGKIFEVFQRLHPKFEYEGTGIGLAICKKIMLNHNGHIKATGEPGVGAKISIYLPMSN